MSMRGVKTSEGWYVKAKSNGEPYPLDSRLAPKFQEAGVTTLSGALQYGASVHGSKPCMATRQLLARERMEHNGKMFEKLKLGEYMWKTYSEVQQMAVEVGLGLRVRGLQPLDRVVIFAETRAEWLVAAMGCLQQRITVVTLYTTLTDAGIAHGINQTGVSLVFTSYELLPRVSRVLSECSNVKTVIVMEDQLEGVGDVNNFPSNVTLVPFKEMIKEDTRKANIITPVPEAEDTAIIMYTSGSTGTPKGVELSHTNILASVVAYSVQMNVSLEDRYLSFLPLAHIMELATEIALISLGATILYSSPHTLTSTSPKVMKGTEGDAKVARPTVMNSVPLVLDRIIKGVSQKVEQQGWIKSFVFTEAVRYKFWLEYIPFTSYFLNTFIFRKVQEELGGELKRVVVGGAPLSPQTHDTMRAIFDVSIQVGYGATESASCITGMDEDDISTGHSGGPNLGVFMKLVDWEEGNYRVTDKPNPRGEIVVGGIVVSKGYFKLPEENEAAFYEENGIRWFRTGDIGEINSLGSLKIIDRKKDLVKLKHGEYVSLGNTESKLKTLSNVENICVFADSTKDKTVAVVVPSADRLWKVAASVGIDKDTVTIEELCADERIKEAILKEIQNHGKKCGLTRWEVPAAVCLTLEPWTPDTGLVTAALKLRRTQLNQYYENSVHDMYSRLD
nr:long-chain-fatty-acid--CoA ligase 4-like [Cherax quadricarinatus]XP_053651173.1 long-chain-fatty-acid--CoA ligase 4-like [Cherax quadricarinatus]XP_053651174.1 long-chain-fatty-acid--CoA ligase 4-like [Cherax quadricarinatus]XP_053651175.1 long-chain-fatty-acid--CoA ligase 4-like [Cherax quadricarinatus]XP_053651176.1 long-chain-fatty-acid--CoA ligase 4-like [Cherax quadricarinatus]XP_053651178.1 long-chain-fatty-acid--CoA ligase 4-like [Cherax quadricarinatus]XP_053651179.1 long-chain-fat